MCVCVCVCVCVWRKQFEKSDGHLSETKKNQKRKKCEKINFFYSVSQDQYMHALAPQTVNRYDWLRTGQMTEANG